MDKNNNTNRSLEDISKDFNCNISDDFSLTKDFGENKLSTKVVNLILTGAICVGAFSTFKHIEFIEKDRIELTNEVHETISNPTIINMDNIESIVKKSESGIYQIENNDKLIVLSYEGDFDTDSFMMDRSITRLMELNHLKNDIRPQASLGKDIQSINYLNMNNSYFSGNIDFYKGNIEADSLLTENEDLWIFAHELNHISKQQYTYIINKDNVETNLSHTLALEGASDIFATIVTSKVKGYNLEETNELIDNIIKMRAGGLDNGDFTHATMFAMKGFKDLINNNPESFNKLKSMDLITIDKISSEYAFDNYRSIDKESNDYIKKNKESIITKENIKQDVENYLNMGTDFQFESNNIKLFQKSKLKSLANGYYSDIIAMAEKIENGESFDDIFNMNNFVAYDSVISREVQKWNYIDEVNINEQTQKELAINFNKNIQDNEVKVSHDKKLLDELKISTSLNENHRQNHNDNVKQNKGLNFKF